MGEFRPNFRSTFHFLRSTLWKVPPGGEWDISGQSGTFSVAKPEKLLRFRDTKSGVNRGLNAKSS